jgi:hypothetical protein
MVLGDELPDGRDKFARDLHHGLGVILRCGLIFCHSFLLRLLFIVLQDSTDSRFIPTWRKLALLHDFLLRRRRYAIKALPVN